MNVIGFKFVPAKLKISECKIPEMLKNINRKEFDPKLGIKFTNKMSYGNCYNRRMYKLWSL